MSEFLEIDGSVLEGVSIEKLNILSIILNSFKIGN